MNSADAAWRRSLAAFSVCRQPVRGFDCFNGVPVLEIRCDDKGESCKGQNDGEGCRYPVRGELSRYPMP
jgi:hypothetical protein